MQKYEIIQVIGEGAYGTVLKCRHLENHEVVAIKKMKEQALQSAETINKVIMREINILKQLKHENVVLLRQVFRKRQNMYLVFQYLNNNLLQILQKHPTGLDSDLIRSFMYQLLKGLKYLHQLNIVHRDIKPENILIDLSNHLKICDFGFARTITPKNHHKYTDYVATRWYRAPELLAGSAYSKEVDLWAVGCIWAELVDGSPIFPGEDQVDQLFLIQKCLGTLTQEQQKSLYDRNKEMSILSIGHDELQTIDMKYSGKLTRNAANLLKQLLKINPSERITASDALNHPYFDELRDKHRKSQNSLNKQFMEYQQNVTISKQLQKVNKITKRAPYEQIKKGDGPPRQMRSTMFKKQSNDGQKMKDILGKSTQMFNEPKLPDSSKENPKSKAIRQIYRIRDYSKPSFNPLTRVSKERVPLNLRNAAGRYKMLTKQSSKVSHIAEQPFQTMNQQKWNLVNPKQAKMNLKYKQMIRMSHMQNSKNGNGRDKLQLSGKKLKGQIKYGADKFPFIFMQSIAEQLDMRQLAHRSKGK